MSNCCSRWLPFEICFLHRSGLSWLAAGSARLGDSTWLLCSKEDLVLDAIGVFKFRVEWESVVHALVHASIDAIFKNKLFLPTC